MASSTTTDEPIFRETTDRFWFFRLVTEVREDGVYVRLDPFQRSFRRIPPDHIRDVTATSYEATAYAGWHWGLRRTPGGNTVYRLRGSEGVEVVHDGERWFIGSRRPERLESAIERIRSPAE